MARRNTVKRGSGHGYKGQNGKLCMAKCFSCGKDNWAPLISTGNCAWCDYSPNEVRGSSADEDHYGDGEE